MKKSIYIRNKDLSITITTSKSFNEIEFIEDSQALSSINTHTFIDQQEWKLHEHVESFKRIASDNMNFKSKRPAISFTCHASRRLF